MAETIKWKKSGPFGSGMTLWEASTSKGALTIHTFGRSEYTLTLTDRDQLPYFSSEAAAQKFAQEFVDFVPKKRAKKRKSAD
jgi:hypothetical protein